MVFGHELHSGYGIGRHHQRKAIPIGHREPSDTALGSRPPRFTAQVRLWSPRLLLVGHSKPSCHRRREFLLAADVERSSLSIQICSSTRGNLYVHRALRGRSDCGHLRPRLDHSPSDVRHLRRLCREQDRLTPLLSVECGGKDLGNLAPYPKVRAHRRLWYHSKSSRLSQADTRTDAI